MLLVTRPLYSTWCLKPSFQYYARIHNATFSSVLYRSTACDRMELLRKNSTFGCRFAVGSRCSDVQILHHHSLGAYFLMPKTTAILIRQLLLLLGRANQALPIWRGRRCSKQISNSNGFMYSWNTSVIYVDWAIVTLAFCFPFWAWQKVGNCDWPHNASDGTSDWPWPRCLWHLWETFLLARSACSAFHRCAALICAGNRALRLEIGLKRQLSTCVYYKDTSATLS